MRIIFILIFLKLYDLDINAQVGQSLVSNKLYFSQSDTLFFSQTHIKTNKVKQVKEYRTDKKYVDSAQLMSEYFFDTLGSIIKSKTYDIHGSSSMTEFTIAPNGKIAESWVTDRNGVRTKTTENIYDGEKLLKQISYYGQDYATSIEFTYRADGLISSIQYFGAGGLKGANTIFVYDSLNRLISEVTKNPSDSIGLSYFYKYDKLGRKYYTEYKEATLGWNETIDYSQSTATSTVEKIYLGDELVEIRTKIFNQQGLIQELITDKRMSIKRRKKPNMFCGYSGSPRYQKIAYEYDSNGNCISKKEYSSPNKIYQRENYSFDKNGNLINKIIYKNSRRDSEWSYSYN